MQKFIYFVGIDISKGTLDFSVVKNGEQVFHVKTTNDLNGIEVFLTHLKTMADFDLSQCVFCMENTGIYNHFILCSLDTIKANICLQSPLQIKYSSGLQRGKNDKIDAKRIAFYAYQKRDILKLWQPQRPIIQQLKHLVSLQNCLIRVKNQLKVSLKETADFAEKTTVKQISGLCKASLRAIEKDLAKTTKAIQVLISSDQQLNHLFNLITSVDGIGDVTATEIILTTNEFKDIKEGKRFAAYAGVVPYEHQSGSSIRGKNRVSKIANQSVKTLLHMAALVAMRYNQELKQYYERKLAEGKNKMLVINAIRNKLVLRIFACVRDNRPYQPQSTKVLQATA